MGVGEDKRSHIHLGEVCHDQEEEKHSEAANSGSTL